MREICNKCKYYNYIYDTDNIFTCCDKSYATFILAKYTNECTYKEVNK